MPNIPPCRCFPDVLHQPVDGVEGVAALVDVFGGLLDRNVRRHLDELASRLEPSADILVDEDIPAFTKCSLVRATPELVGSIGPLEYGVRLMRIGYFFDMSFGE